LTVEQLLNYNTLEVIIMSSNETKKNIYKIDNETNTRMAQFLKVFGDETRLRILFLLEEKEYTVTELVEKISMTKSAISHQLKTLKDNRIVKMRKVGKNIYFSLNDDHVSKILNITVEHIKEE